SILLYGMLCNHASLLVQRGKYVVDGDPTDGALLIAARKLGLTEVLKENYKIIKEIPFDSTKKRMSVVIEDENKRRCVITKGAPEMILPRCTHFLSEHGHKRLDDVTPFNNVMNEMAEQALRTIANSI